MNYQGPERRHNMTTRARFDAAVEEAAARAAQRVAAIHRRRLVVQSFLAALIISASVALIVGFIIGANERSFARQNAEYDCNLFTQAATAMGNFVQSDANLRSKQSKAGFGKKLVADIEKVIPAADLAQLAITQQRQNNQAVSLWNNDARTLLSLGGTDCIKHLGG